MIIAKQSYSLPRQIVGACEDRESPASYYRLMSVGRLVLAYPFIIVPAFLSVDSFFEKSPYPEFATVLLGFWYVAHGLLLVSSLVALLACMEWLGKRSFSYVQYSTLVCLIFEVATTLLIAFILGLQRSMPHFLIFMIVVIYRTLLPYRYALFACLTTVLLYCCYALYLYQFPALITAAMGMPEGYQVATVDFFGSLLTFVGITFMLFVSVNYLVNQRNILESYLTQHVLTRYLPPRLVEQASLGNLEFEHKPESRVVTVLFADLVGFTRLSQELGAEGVGRVIDVFISGVSKLAHYHGGTIDKFIGDCVMIFFGAPDEMTPEAQAYRCAEMARQIQEYVDSAEWGTDLSVRVGMSTGEAVVGHFGSEFRSDYTVIGHTVNLAARLESVCPPGSILLGDETARYLGDAINLERVGPFNLKGVGDEVYAWKVSE